MGKRGLREKGLVQVSRTAQDAITGHQTSLAAVKVTAGQKLHLVEGMQVTEPVHLNRRNRHPEPGCFEVLLPGKDVIVQNRRNHLDIFPKPGVGWAVKEASSEDLQRTGYDGIMDGPVPVLVKRIEGDLTLRDEEGAHPSIQLQVHARV